MKNSEELLDKIVFNTEEKVPYSHLKNAANKYEKECKELRKGIAIERLHWKTIEEKLSLQDIIIEDKNRRIMNLKKELFNNNRLFQKQIINNEKTLSKS